jgi:aspartyl-tRNA(Asn)/glutamyl-tRNA(Gln) amidotransferase subunit C
MSKISNEQVKNVAVLSRLELSDAEVKKYQESLSDILGYIELLEKIDTTKTPPTSQVTGLVNVYRDDKIQNSPVTREQILKNTPESLDGYIKVKSVLK